jgi:hypothetical protein
MLDIRAFLACQQRDHQALRGELLIGLPASAADWRPGPGLPTLGWHLVHSAYVAAAVAVCGDGVMAPVITRWAPICHVGCPLPAAGVVGDLPAVLATVAELEALTQGHIATWSDAQWHEPLPVVDPVLLAEGCHRRWQALATMATHDAYHLGQVALIRRLAGIAHLE